MTTGRIAGFTFGAAWVGLVLAVAAAAPGAAGPLERLLTRYHGSMPACDSPWVLAVISRRFAVKEDRFWSSSISLDGFDRVREIADRPWAPDAIPRRYCQAKLNVSGGRERRDTMVYYSIGSNTGFAGAIWGVEWCVVGYDRNFAYAPRCRMARP